MYLPPVKLVEWTDQMDSHLNKGCSSYQSAELHLEEQQDQTEDGNHTVWNTLNL